MLDCAYSKKQIDYPKAITTMDGLVEQIKETKKNSTIWFLEHPHIYTAGSSAGVQDLIDKRFPVYNTGRGGKYTYHGPGQRVVYLMIDLNKVQNKTDIKKFIADLEKVAILTFQEIGIKTFLKEGMVGIWTNYNNQDLKIAAIGIRVKKWITYHGIAFNISPDLSAFQGIVPCGIKEYGVTSLKELGYNITLEEFDRKFIKHFCAIFDLKISRHYEI